MSAVAIIPARGGSQRIPGKNLKLFNGEPMIVWSIRAALASGVFERVVVSTDSEQIADVARAHGAEVPFMRPVELADAYTGTAAVIKHAVSALHDAGERADFACCIYATAPLLQIRYLQQGLELLRAAADKSYAFSVCDYGFPVQRALYIDEVGALQAMYPQYRDSRSQDLMIAYQDAGQFYWGRCNAWLRSDVIFSDVSLPVILPRYLVQDIDTEQDWLRAEYMYAALKAGGELA
ncbi:pseudaminic acid cytidylyltransferase [Pseudomonas sp. CDFA 602]|uniref:pseudaminic acid cytidylyltransferase n=1 Tax=Pseudomonas californiensis TaxID=2829823 RepID=UPI001E4A4731|nr:pseudaminic acid cytidylyltransferase [Pseudomonas californiensis]MCD5992988.1 pseudaminic acid cytidylyltransferase [Pseudomonas californiensis]MCD5998365.1 pseudaminic acid cytidylyltransferase [Pseudomonas californiensis]